MANTPSNIRGGFAYPNVYVGAPSATAPADISAVPDPATYFHLGLVTEDGITLGRSIDVQKVRAMGVTSQYVYTRITGQESTIALTFMETRSEVLSLYNRQPMSAITSNAATTGSGAHPQYIVIADQPSTQPLHYSMLLDLSDGTYTHRRYFPNVQVSDTGDLVYTTSGDPLGYSVTFEVILGDDGLVPLQMFGNVAKATGFTV